MSSYSWMQQLGSAEREQIEREKAQRDYALGKRISLMQSGEVAPAIRRWVNGSVSPVSLRLREASRAVVERGDLVAAGDILSTPTLGALQTLDQSISSLTPLFTWTLRGTSPGRLGTSTTFTEDIVLTALGTLLNRIVIKELRQTATQKQRGGELSLNASIALMARSIRECVLGQWVSTFQGTKSLASMQTRLNRGKGQTWKRKSELDGVANLLLSQVRPQLESRDRGEVDLESAGHKTVVKVIEPWSQKERRLDIKEPDAIDWQVLQMARRVQGEADEYVREWATFAFVILCAIQRELGWFDLVSQKSTHKKASKRHKAKYLVLSDEARENIMKDAEAWTKMGFHNEPMITPPENGGYLTVKRRAVSNKGAPGKDAGTKAEDSWQWQTACDVLAGTPWYVNRDYLDDQSLGWDDAGPYETFGTMSVVAVRKSVVITADHARLGDRPFWLPIYMDFRGRLYPRTSTVTYQGSDLQKSLLKFSLRGRADLDLLSPENANLPPPERPPWKDFKDKDSRGRSS